MFTPRQSFSKKNRKERFRTTYLPLLKKFKYPRVERKKSVASSERGDLGYRHAFTRRVLTHEGIFIRWSSITKLSRESPASRAKPSRGESRGLLSFERTAGRPPSLRALRMIFNLLRERPALAKQARSRFPRLHFPPFLV